MYLSKNEIIAGSILTVLGIFSGLFFLSVKSRKPSIKALEQYLTRKNPKIMTVRVSNQQRQFEIIDFMKSHGYNIVKQTADVKTITNANRSGSINNKVTWTISAGNISRPNKRTIVTQIITFQKN